MSDLPAGTVTFLFTDIEGSTRLLEAQAEAYRSALARHDAILHDAVVANNGVIFQSRGDGVCAAFASPVSASHVALAAQAGLGREAWGETGPVRVRMALHTGAVELHGVEFFGAPLHRTARLLDSAHGGQTVVSAATAALIGDALPAGAWLTDLGEYHLRDLRAERIFQLCGPGLPAEFPPLRSGAASPNNLPPQATAFIGREQQRRGVAETLLRTDIRLVTLTGPGGTGKTRLSLQVAADLLEHFRDGVYFVPLGSMTDPDLVLSAIAQALDVRESAGRSIAVAIAHLLGPKELLLVLDNFEQVLPAASRIAELLTAAPRLKVLVTSRAVLRLYGEREHPVPPLTLPDRRANPTAAHLVEFEAVRLFVDRAQAARPDFALSDENGADIAEICQRLDGLPLALELAAARIRSLPPRAMLQRMQRRLPLLTGGARDLPARQRTLRDAIAWSYELLEPSEQTLFQRLGVFWGCSLEAAETVCAGDPPRPGATSVALSPLEIDVLDGLESLVEKSLVRQSEGVEGQPRYSMLETIREYALERLAESGEADAVHRRHSLGALRFAEMADPSLYGEEQVRWFARVEQAHDNLRAALRWCEEHGYAEPSYRLAVALWWFWSVHGHASEGRERLTSILDRFPVHASSKRGALRARALIGAEMLASLQGDYQAARTHGEEALQLQRAIGDPAGVFGALESLGTVCWLQGDYQATRRYAEEALRIARDLGDARGYAMVLNILGNVSYELGDLDVARSYFEDCDATLSQNYGIHGIALSLALVAQDQGRLDEAESIAAGALERCRRQGQAHLEALALSTLGAISAARGDLKSARGHLQLSLTISHSLGDPAAVVQVLERFVELAAALDRHDAALVLGGAAEALRERAGAQRSRSGQAKLDAALAPARLALGEDAAETAWRSGRTLSLDDAVTFALTLTDTVVPTDAPPARAAPNPQAHGARAILTERELEVARLIAQGHSNKQIAETLVVTDGTAANHVHNVLGKLGFANRAQVAAWIREHGL
jgi:predicted ATPase/class 3 adenylate cyclase/DNA-binding CsgD family transcriptional regulator